MVEGILVIDSTPGGATIYINGVKQPDPTPGGILIAPGTYTIRLTWPGYYDWEDTVTVVANYQGQVTRIYPVMNLAEVRIVKGMRGPGMIYLVVNGVKLRADQVDIRVKPGDVIGVIAEFGGIGAKFDKIVITSIKAGVMETKTYTNPLGITFMASAEYITVDGYFTQIPLPTIAWGLIVSEPSGAGVFIDGKDIGQVTPATIDNIAAGQHSYELRLFGYKPATGTFLAEIGKSFAAFANMVSCPPIQCEQPLNGYEKDGCGNRRLKSTCNPLSKVAFSSTPLGAEIFMDGQDQSTKTPATITDVPAGSHTYALKLAGYNDYTGTVQVSAGQTAQVSATLTPVSPSCTPNWQCEKPLNGYESDGCGNRRQYLGCAVLPPAEAPSRAGVYLAVGTVMGVVAVVALVRR